MSDLKWITVFKWTAVFVVGVPLTFVLTSIFHVAFIGGPESNASKMLYLVISIGIPWWIGSRWVKDDHKVEPENSGEATRPPMARRRRFLTPSETDPDQRSKASVRRQAGCTVEYRTSEREGREFHYSRVVGPDGVPITPWTYYHPSHHSHSEVNAWHLGRGADL